MASSLTPREKQIVNHRAKRAAVGWGVGSGALTAAASPKKPATMAGAAAWGVGVGAVAGGLRKAIDTRDLKKMHEQHGNNFHIANEQGHLEHVASMQSRKGAAHSTKSPVRRP